MRGWPALVKPAATVDTYETGMLDSEVEKPAG